MSHLTIIEMAHPLPGFAGCGPSTVLEVLITPMRKRFLLLSLAVLAVFLAGCSVSLVNDPGQGQRTAVLHTPSLSPTPTAPPYTIGAYASNPSPRTSDTVTIYVIFHMMQNGSSKPVGGASVSLYFHTYGGNGIDQLNSQAGGKQTANDGWAAFTLTYTNLPNQSPVLVDVTVQANGQTYIQKSAAFFTPLQGSVTPSPPPGG